MRNTEPETSVIARILATGFNRHIRDHGPDGDYASETLEMGDGHGVVVHRGDSQFSVRVERLPAMTTTAPKTPGQCWAALREALTAAQANFKSAIDTTEGTEQATSMAFAAAYEYALDQMRKLEA